MGNENIENEIINEFGKLGYIITTDTETRRVYKRVKTLIDLDKNEIVDTKIIIFKKNCERVFLKNLSDVSFSLDLNMLDLIKRQMEFFKEKLK